MRTQILLLFVGVSLLALAGCNKEGNDTEETTDGGAGTISERTESTETDQAATESDSAAPQKTGVSEKPDVSGAASGNQNIDDVIDKTSTEKIELTSLKPVKVIPAVFTVSTSAQAPAKMKPVSAEEKRASTVDAAIAAAMRDASDGDKPQATTAQVVRTVESAQSAQQEKRVETIQYGDPLNRIATVSERTVWSESSRKTRSRTEPVVLTETVVTSGETTRRSSRTTSYSQYSESSSTQCFTGG